MCKDKMYKDLLETMDKSTQVYKVLKYMIEHGSITSYEAFSVLMNTRLSATIYELKNRYGVNIDMTMERTSSGKKYGIYRLKEEKE